MSHTNAPKTKDDGRPVLRPFYSSGEAGVLGKVPWKERQELAYEIGAVFGQNQKLPFTVSRMFIPLEIFPDWLRRIVAWGCAATSRTTW
ncbi:MAG: hypothetical protein JW918_07940 [Anaerolineae bacterium]|nr:hypothetical protein [Anaerolineae bacterium]